MVDSTKDGQLEEASDDNLKIHQLIDRQGKKAAKGKSAGSLFSSLFEASMAGPLSSHTEGLPMLTLKHRWMKNRNLTSGSTTVSFNADGVAKVRDIGNARLDCEQLCRQYPGLIEVVTEKAPEEPPEAPQKVEESPKVEEQRTVEELSEDTETAQDEEKESVSEKFPPVKKAPPKRKK